MSKKTDIWMPLYIGDYLANTTRLTTEQHGAYLLLIMDYWRNGPPPDEDPTLATIVRASQPAWKKIRPSIVGFFEVTEGKWVHHQLDDDLRQAGENKKKAVEKAAKGASARWSKHQENNAPSNAPSIDQALLNECPSSSSLSTKPKTPHTPQGGRKEKAVSLETFLDMCKKQDRKPIREDDPVFAYANEAGIPHEFLRIQWYEFKDRYSENGAKKYVDWPRVFRKSVRGNWFRLWWCKNDSYELTTQGIQAKNVYGVKQ